MALPMDEDVVETSLMNEEVLMSVIEEVVVAEILPVKEEVVVEILPVKEEVVVEILPVKEEVVAAEILPVKEECLC